MLVRLRMRRVLRKLRMLRRVLLRVLRGLLRLQRAGAAHCLYYAHQYTRARTVALGLVTNTIFYTPQDNTTYNQCVENRDAFFNLF